MARVLILGGYNVSLVNFRGKLIERWVEEGHEVVACAPGEDEAVTAKLEKLGARYRSVPLSRASTQPIEDLKSLLQLRKVFREEKPDAAFLYTIKPVIYGSLAAHAVGVPRIHSMITGLGYAFGGGTSLKQRTLRTIVTNLYRAALKRNQGVFFQNEDDAELFVREKLVARDQITLTAGSGVDLSHYQVEPIPDGPARFVMCSRILRDKGIQEFIEAAKLVKKKVPQVEFEHVGPFDTENPGALTEADVARWNDADQVHFHGETEDVRLFLKRASVYVLPSYYPEGAPRTILEAASMGRPVITTDNPGGCRQTVRPGETGYLVKPRDSQALAETMMRFVESPESIPKMGAAGRRYMEERFDVNKVNQLILETMNLAK